MSTLIMQGLRIKLQSQDAAPASGAANPPPQLQQLLVMQDLYLAGGAQTSDSKLLCKGENMLSKCLGEWSSQEYALETWWCSSC